MNVTRLHHNLAILGAAALLLSAALPALAQVTVIASCNKNILSLDDTLNFQVKVDGTRDASPPDLSGLDGFNVLQGPNLSTSIQIVNFKTVQNVTYSYILKPLKTGKLNLGPFKVTAENNTYVTKPISIEVVKASAQPPSTTSADPNRLLTSENLFLTMQADSKSAYVNGQILLTVTFYFKPDIDVVSVDQPVMNFDGFIVHDASGAIREKKTVKNQPFDTVRFQKLLVPIKTGSISIAPVEMTVTVREPSSGNKQRRSIFDDPFGIFPSFTRKNVVLQSNPLSLSILPLPDQGKPASFNGAVGKVILRASAEPRTVEVGDPVTVTVELSGAANIDTLSPDFSTNTSDFRVYDPETTRESSVSGGRLIGKKTYTQVWIPNSVDANQIPAVNFSYFDTELLKYVTLRKGPFDLNVSPAPNQKLMVTELAAPVSSRSRIKILRQDIFGIKPEPDSNLFARRAYTSPAVITLFIAPPLLWSCLALITSVRRKLHSDTALYRRVRANRQADSRLLKARDAIRHKDARALYAAISDALCNFIADKLHIAAPQVSAATVDSLCSAKSVSPETIKHLKALLEQCDFARFASASFDTKIARDHYSQAQHLLRSLQKELR